jgi:hypothetical protein
MNAAEDTTVDKVGNFSARYSAATHTVIVSEWTVDTADRQQATIEAIVAAWKDAIWQAGLLSTMVLTSSLARTEKLY